MLEPQALSVGSNLQSRVSGIRQRHIVARKKFLKTAFQLFADALEK